MDQFLLALPEHILQGHYFPEALDILLLAPAIFPALNS